MFEGLGAWLQQINTQILLRLKLDFSVEHIIAGSSLLFLLGFLVFLHLIGFEVVGESNFFFTRLGAMEFQKFTLQLPLTGGGDFISGQVRHFYLFVQDLLYFAHCNVIIHFGG